MGATITTVWAGEVGYETALGWQEQLVAARKADDVDDVLLLLTHPPVYTAGRNADIEKNLTGRRPDIPVVRIDRGGDLTYHGPGQVVAYPITRLAQPHATRAYVTALEQALIDTCATYGLDVARRDGYPGVWDHRPTPPAKLAQVGIRVTEGVTKHGIALNVDPVMDDFTGIIPCGIVDGDVTSMAALGVDAAIDDVAARLGAALARHLDRTPVHAHPLDLGLQALA